MINMCGEHALSRVVSRSGQRDFQVAGKDCSTTASELINVIFTPEAIHRVNDLVHCDRWITENELAVHAGIGHGSIHTIQHERLGYRKVCAHCVAWNDTAEQKAQSLRVCEGHLKGFQEEGDSFLLHIVAGDESTCNYHDSESRRESMQWKYATSPPPKKSRCQPSAKKVMPTFLFDYHGYLLIEFLPRGAIINGESYQTTIRNLRVKIKQNRCGSLTSGVMLLHDNA